MFSITYGKGFQIKFSNGYTVSSQFGATNYCEHYSRHLDDDYRFGEEQKIKIYSSRDCEVAIWDEHDNWITSQVVESLGMESTEKMVQACVSPEDYAKIIACVSAMKGAHK